MKNFALFVWDVIKIFVVALAVVIPIRYFLFQPFFVSGQSMEPNFENGNYLIIDEITYRFREPQRGEVIVFKYPQNPSQRYIKRIIGLPGETIEIENGKIVIYKNNREILLNESGYLSGNFETYGDIKTTMDKDEYFVMGDNRPYSFDSRRWGVLPRENIIGRVYLRMWPILALAKISAPGY